ncbi:helix-turn-helix transcriptional regulator [Actinomyces vulturis]|uniref:helix-turn-helix transcriptional regulator n=1 Tax=Actinomyces vulturis TaxID=1857645 RepID=UPI00082BE69E|nr:helix-turn-helix domain-containing protein [Actinomyces vulturis]
MNYADDAGTRAKVLDLIVEKGPVSAAQMARVLRLTPAAVRRHITALENSGDIEVHEVPQTSKRGRGRPARHYVATTKAASHLPEGYSELATRALNYLSQVAGGEAVDSFAAARGRDLERRYIAIVNAAGKDPADRARALADALTADGYAATVRDIGDGSFAVQLCQGHCPVREVAGEFHALCDAETQAFSRLLGVPVQRLATLAGGEHVCTTHVPVAMPTLRARAARTTDQRGQRSSRMEGHR